MSTDFVPAVAAPPPGTPLAVLVEDEALRLVREVAYQTPGDALTPRAGASIDLAQDGTNAGYVLRKRLADGSEDVYEVRISLIWRHEGHEHAA